MMKAGTNKDGQEEGDFFFFFSRKNKQDLVTLGQNERSP